MVPLTEWLALMTFTFSGFISTTIVTIIQQSFDGILQIRVSIALCQVIVFAHVWPESTSAMILEVTKNYIF